MLLLLLLAAAPSAQRRSDLSARVLVLISAKCGIELQPGDHAIVLHGGQVRHEERRTKLPSLQRWGRNDADERRRNDVIAAIPTLSRVAARGAPGYKAIMTDFDPSDTPRDCVHGMAGGCGEPCQICGHTCFDHQKKWPGCSDCSEGDCDCEQFS